MSDGAPSVEIVPREVDIRSWVESARRNPVLYRDRQVTEIVLAAIGLAPSLREALVLKGGTLMALAFKSRRVTGDVDFTALVEPEGFPERLASELNKMLPRAAARLGYVNLVCRVQSTEKKPRPQNFENHDFPALHVRIASAERGTAQERALRDGRAARVLQLEITFRDEVYAFQELNLGGARVAVQAFTVGEIIAEKLRALLQQPIRKRGRRQDVYDIAFLLREHGELDHDARFVVHRTLLEKCRTRSITPTRASIADPEVVERARRDWNTMKLEVAELPKFEECYTIVQSFYENLPW